MHNKPIIRVAKITLVAYNRLLERGYKVLITPPVYYGCNNKTTYRTK